MQRCLLIPLLLVLAACGQALPEATSTNAPTTDVPVVAAAAPESSPTAEPTALIPTTLPSPTVEPTVTVEPTAVIPPTATVPPPPPGGLAQARVAPPITDEVWLNSEPLSVADLGKEGKVTLVEFWTYSCYNCQNVLPHLRDWHSTYADQGLTIIGVHYPEFKYERDVENVKQALIDQKIDYPVSIDNDGTTWRAYGQRYWPTMYLVDKQGQIRYLHIGEGAYTTTEQWIQYLLAE